MDGETVRLRETPEVWRLRAEAATARGVNKQFHLTVAVLWPTVTVTGNHNRSGLSEKSGDGLATPLSRALWPTATRADGTGGVGHNGRDGGLNLRTAVAAKLSEWLPWATPAARDYRDTGTSPSEHKRHSPGNAALAGGSLNPAWVEALMGFPAGWTDIAGPQDAAKHKPRGSRRASRRGALTDERG